jgi:hypothetical protein
MLVRLILTGLPFLLLRWLLSKGYGTAGIMLPAAMIYWCSLKSDSNPTKINGQNYES